MIAKKWTVRARFRGQEPPGALVVERSGDGSFICSFVCVFPFPSVATEEGARQFFESQYMNTKPILEEVLTVDLV